MAEDGKIIYKVVINADGVVEQVESVGQSAGAALEKHARSGGGAFKEIMTGAARAIGEAFVQMTGKAVEGVKQIIASGVEFNAKMEQYQTAFTTLLGDAEAAADAMKRIREDAARTPFDVDSLTSANQMLVSAGLSADQAREDILNLANAIAATGGGSDELARMAANMQQIQNTGKATAMDIRQFANAGINIYGLLADAMGVTTEQAAEMDVSYEQLAAALAHAAEAGGMYEGAMEAQSQTFNGRLSTLKDNIAQLEGALTEDLFSKLSDTALPMVMEWVAKLLEAAETGGIEGAVKAAKEILHSIVEKIIDGLPDVLDAGFTLLENLLNGISAESSAETFKTIGKVIGAILEAIGTHLPLLVAAGIQACVNILDGFITALTGHSTAELWKAFTDFVEEIVQFFKNTWDKWVTIGEEIVEGIKKGIADMWNDLVSSVTGWVSDLWDGVCDFLGINSPSKKFRYIGEACVEGTEVGFEDQEAELTRTVRTVYEDAGDTAAKAMRSAMEAPDFTAAGFARAVSYDMSSSSAVYNTGGAVYNITVNGIEELQQMLNWYNSREIVGRMA